MSQETKRFPLRDLLTVTTGRLLTEPRGPEDNGISALYDLLGWMTNDSPYTHQIPRFCDECKPWLLRWFPELARVNAELGDDINGLGWWIKGATVTGKPVAIGIHGWMIRVQVDCGLQYYYDVPRIPQDDHERKNPYDELVAERGTDDGIVIHELPEDLTP